MKEERKEFFFEKKKQRTFANLTTRPISKWAAYANKQKLLDSCFQKIIPSFLFSK